MKRALAATALAGVISTGYNPRPWQVESHAAIARVRYWVEIVHRRGGKTVLASNSLIDAALRCQRKEPRYAYIAPELKQARRNSWSAMREYTRVIPGVEYSESRLEVALPHGATITLYGADNIDALRGIYLDGVVLDEVAQMRPNVWDEVIRPTLADREGWAGFIGTPKGINLLSQLYYYALAHPETWHAALRTWRDTGAIPDAEIAALRASMSEARFRQEFECDFAAGADDALISLDLARACFGRHLREDQYQHAPRVMGVDVARYGSDRTAIARRQGLWGLPIVPLQGADTQAVVSRVTSLAKEFNPDLIFVDIGYNPGVYDNLSGLGWNVTPVNFGSKSGAPQYANKRAEMWCEMRDWLAGGAAIPADDALLADLVGPKFWSRSGDGCLVLESKDDMRERGIPSPDLGDALALTFAFPVPHKATHGSLGPSSQPMRTDFDPFA